MPPLHATLHDLVDHCIHPMALISPDYRYFLVNKAYCDLLHTSRQKIVGHAVEGFVDPQLFNEQVREHIDACLAGETVVTDYSGEDPGAGFRAMRMEYTPYRDADGMIVGVLTHGTDITERVRLEERYRSLFTMMHNGVGVLQPIDNGADFIFVDFNPAAERIENTPADQVVGKRVTDVFPGVTEFGLLDAFRRVLQTGEPTTHPVRLYQDDRISGWRENYVCKIATGEIVSVYEDVTKQKQAEEALRTSEKRLRLLVENAPYGLVIIDGPTETVTYATPSYDRLLDRKPGESVGRQRPRILETIHPEDREYTLETIAAAISARQDLAQYTFRLAPRAGKEECWIHNAVHFEYAPDGSLATSYIVAHDVTARMRLERELRHAVEEKTLLMRELNHRVKNNLMLAAALVQLKEDEMTPEFDLSDISARINAIATLHETLQFSDDVREVALDSYMRTALTSVCSLDRRAITLSVDAYDVSVPSQVAVSIGLITSEIATNAMKHGFTDDDPPTFSFTARQNDGMCTVVISNNGRALPEQVTAGERGGFGLNIIKTLASQINGNLTITGEPHPVFTIEVPVT
jgi:PAS domain S-box-containing protein